MLDAYRPGVVLEMRFWGIVVSWDDCGLEAMVRADAGQGDD